MASIVGGYFQMQLTWEDLIIWENITADTRNHLQRVYLSLFLIFLSLVVGFYVEFLVKFGGLVSIVICLGILISFFFIQPHREITRVSLLIGAAFFQGVSIGYLVDIFIPINASLVITALLVIAFTCGCFTVAAMTEKEDIYWGGIEFSMPPVMVCNVVAFEIFKHIGEPSNIPDPYSLLWVCFIVYMWFLVYLLTYSQEVVVRFRSQNYDYIWQHAVTFFTHMPAVHVYTIFIVLRKAYGRIRPQPQLKLQPELEQQPLQQEQELQPVQQDQPVQPELELQPLQ